MLAGLVASQGANAFTLIVIARKVPFLEYGQYLASYGLAGLTITLPNAGLDTFLLSQNSNNPRYIYALWKRVFRLRLKLLVLWVLIIGLIASYLLPSETYPLVLVCLVALSLAGDSLTQISYSAMRNLNRHKEVTVLQIFTSTVVMSIAIIWPSGPGQIIKFNVIRALVSSIFALAIFARMNVACVSYKPYNVVKNLLPKVAPFLAADLAVTLYLKADLTIVALCRGSYGASVYGSALNIVHILFLIPNALYLVVLPLLAKKFVLDRSAFFQASKLYFALQFFIGFLITITLYLLSPFLTKLFLGPMYLQSVVILRVLSPLIVLKSLNFGMAAILTSANLQPWRTTAQLVSALFNVFANIAVIGYLDIVGVALVYLLSESLLLSGYTLAVFTRFLYEVL